MRIAPRLLTLLAAIAALPLNAAVTGSVMNSDGGPIAGAKISIFTPETLGARRERFMTDKPLKQPLVTATTDSSGNFRIEPPKDAPIVDLRIDATGYAPEGMRLQSDDEAGATILTAAETKSGTVRANGKGVAGATVIWTGSAEYTTTTDANGKYTVPDPSKWANRVVILHPDYARLEEQLMLAKRDVDRTLTAGVKVTGKVVGEDGTTGVADAALVLDGWPAGKSGADGTFTIAHAPKDWKELHAISGARIAARAAGGPLTLKLAKGATISGTIRDAKTQLPLPGAEVQLSAGARNFGGGGGFAFRSLFTDAKGNYSLGPLPAGSYSLYTIRPNYTIPPATVSVAAAQAQSKPLFATAYARVSGTVVDEDKRPVAAARVNAANAGRDGGIIMIGARGLTGRGAVSGPDGRFVVRVSELDTDVQVHAQKKGYPATKSAIMRLAAGERKSGLTLTIPRGIAFSGRVLDRNGKPLSGVSIDAGESQGDFPAGIRRMMINMAGNRGEDTVNTASDGTFTVRLKEGKYDVTFKREGFAAKTLRAQTVATNQRPVEVTLDPGVEITGRVVRGGAGVEGVNVNAISEGGPANAVTGPDGSFTISDLTPGQMMLSVNKAEAMIQEMRPITAPARDVLIDLPAGGRITGRVVDKATHRPLTSFQAGVTSSRGGGGMVIMMPPIMRSFTSDDGTFTLENVKPGPVQIVADAPGYTSARGATVEVEDGKTISDVEVALEAGAKLSGRVTDSSGSPVSGVSVRPDGGGPGAARMMRFDMAESSSVTDPNGEYTLDSVEPGEKTFTFARSGYVSETKTITVASGKDNRLDVVLGSGLRLGGMVVTEGGAPVSEATVRVMSASGGGREAHTDAGGAFQMEGIAPGHYTFTATKAGMANGILRDVDVSTANNIRIVMKSGATISGHVTGLAQKDLEQTTVSASSPNGNASAPVDAGGNFRIDGAPSGTVRVGARVGQMFGASGRSSAPKSVELEPGGSAQVDIEFKSDTVIHGRVTQNNQPLASATLMFMPRQGKTQTSASTTTDASGRYEISGLDDGPYNVQVMEPQRMAPYTAQYEVHGSGNFDIDVRTSELRGRVLDAATGQPLQDAQIDLRPARGDSGFFGSRSAVTDSNGAFYVNSLARGDYQVSADRQGYGHQTKELSVGDSPQELEFKLNASDGLVINVVDGRDHKPIGANARVVDMQGRDVSGDAPFRFGGSGAEPIRVNASPGTYRVTVMAMGYAHQTFMVDAPSTRTLALTPGGTLLIHSKASTQLRGRLIDSNGWLYFSSPGNPAGTFTLLESPGTTTLQNVASGHYRLDVLDSGDQVVKSIEIDVLEGRPASYDI